MKYLRLKKQADFQKLFQHGKRAFSASLTMVYRASDKTRMGISVGKKHGKSVQRNRIKRLIREAFRLAQGEMKCTGNARSLLTIETLRDVYGCELVATDMLPYKEYSIKPIDL